MKQARGAIELIMNDNVVTSWRNIVRTIDSWWVENSAIEIEKEEITIALIWQLENGKRIFRATNGHNANMEKSMF